jgi:DNA-binding winged helix-turn-helix (wHTH) protein
LDGHGSGSKFIVGKWTVDPERLRISDGQDSFMLQPRVMSLLQHLAAHEGEVISHEQLIEAVWRGRVVEDGAVYQALAKLRHALGDDSQRPRYIETVPTKGYRLVATVGPAVARDQVQFAQPGRSVTSRHGRRRWIILVLILAVAAVIMVAQSGSLAAVFRE